MTGGQAPISPCQVSRISRRRFAQSAADFTGVPSANRRGERYGPKSLAYSAGGLKNGASSRARASADAGAGGSAAKAAAAAPHRRQATRLRDMGVVLGLV